MNNLLPIKTKDGMIKKLEFKSIHKKKKHEITECNLIHQEHFNDNYFNLKDTSKETKINSLSIVKLLAYREQKLRLFRFKIGALASDLLDHPEEKITNLIVLLNFMEERVPEIFMSVRKLAAATLLEIFRDLLPLYKIHVAKKNEIKLKKETLQLQYFESSLLKYYKEYLRKLEKMVLPLRRTKHKFVKQNIHLGIFSIVCLSSLLITRPDANFSSNIANFLIPYLNHKNKNIRKLIEECFAQVVKYDKPGDLTLTIIRRLNKFLKINKFLVNIEVISVLRGLRVENIDLQRQKEEETEYKKFDIIIKKELKMKKKFKEIQKEMLATKAEHNKLSKQKKFKEIFDTVIMVYLRILKSNRSNLLIAKSLEGLSKFIDFISIDFCEDLLGFLDKSLQTNNFPFCEQLFCIYVAFVILSNQLTMMNIDPCRFYMYLYKNLLEIHNGRTHKEIDIILQTLLQSLLDNSKSTTENCLFGFVKRIFGTTLAVEQNSTLALMLISMLIIQNCHATSVLIDTDCSDENTFYLSNKLQYFHACFTRLWEVTALQRHYHETIQSVSSQILFKASFNENVRLPGTIFKYSPREIFKLYDPLLGCFQPNIYLPKNVLLPSIRNISLTSTTVKLFKTMFDNNLFVHEYYDIYNEFK